jgi:hypothetical protein
MTPYLDQLLVSSSEAGDNCVAVWGGHPGKAGREIGTQRPPLRLPLHSFEALSYKVTTLRHFLAPKQEQETAYRTVCLDPFLDPALLNFGKKELERMIFFFRRASVTLIVWKQLAGLAHKEIQPQ